MRVIAVDIETSCGVQTCPGYGLSNSSKCTHALHHRLNKIDIIGAFDGENYHQFDSVEQFDSWLAGSGGTGVVGHGFKFDYKTLRSKGSRISPRQIVGDTQLLGACVHQKVSQKWLKTYNERRAALNAELPPKQRHRVGTPLSLKTMAPFYLGVEPFWENPASHDDPEYNRLDCEYTYLLHEKLLGAARQNGTAGFYENYLVPWQKLLAEAEHEGVLVDEKLLHKMYGDACKELVQIENEIHAALGDCFGAYRDRLAVDLRIDSDARLEKYLSGRSEGFSKREATIARYEGSLAEKIAALPERFNLQSSQQMLFILEYHGIDTAVEKKDKETNEWIESEGTDKFVLKRAKVQQKSEFAAKLLTYREKETEVSYLKQYINAVVDGRIYCSFSIVGTRTGRLSSSGPNLQNVKGSLRAPFVVADRDKYSIYTVDSAQIEPRVIAYLTGDPGMVKLFQDGRSYHNYATPLFFPEEVKGTAETDIKKKFPQLYKTAKIGDLSIIYGTGEHTFQKMCLVREEMDFSLEHSKKLVQNFRSKLSHVMRWKERLEYQYREDNHCITDGFGYPVTARDGKVKMTLFNTYVQGCASRMIFHASLLAFREFCKLGIDAKPLLWVHDEVCWRFPKESVDVCKAVVDKYMTGYKLETPHGRVPLDVEGIVGDRWQK